ncbi:NFACT RNA binding domain-containing protein [Wukongibacter baidiensis]|uniref:Rqc2 family fibronectin-binding protein n=1 Tax=Wukongibacter baidiensis TaxID=1723361 RepID=UPI003D7F2E92
MPFDGLVINSLAFELKNALLNKKIEKIYQPEEDEILIKFRNVENNNKLLISVNSSFPHLCLTNSQKSNPLKPPMFCMLLRKHLHGGKVVDVYQVDFERIIVLSIESYDELGNISIKDLVVEVMGKHSNIILMEKDNLNIIDSIKRIPTSISRQRQILPGLEYRYPPSQDKLNVFDIDYTTFIDQLEKASENAQIYKALYKLFQGISPIIAKNICFNAKVDTDILISEISKEDLKRIWDSFVSLSDKLHNNEYSPNVIFDSIENKAVDFSSLSLGIYDNQHYTQTFLPSISNVINRFYFERDKYNRIKQKSTDIMKVLNTRLGRLYNKLQKQNEELITAEGADKYKLYGELILSNMYQITAGMKEVTVQNFYEPEAPDLVILLDSRLTPSENSQRYYKKYNKYKTAQEKISEQIRDTESEIEYLENVLTTIENTDDINNIDEIKQELVEQKYIRKRKTSKNKSKKIDFKPHKYVSKDGFMIFAGKNNKQNDHLTLKFASKKDIWLHTKDIPGSHVIIKTDGKDVPDETIMAGAIISAYHSKGRQSSNVPIDYTHVKFVKKPSGAKPGMVIYENFKTIYVTPHEEEIKKLEVGVSE